MQASRTTASEAHWSDLDRHFGRFLSSRAGRADDAVCVAAMLASRATAEGDVCVRLEEHAERAIADTGYTAPALAQWMAHLRASGIVGAPGDFHPLILDDAGRLYLYRYWDYETRLGRALLERARDVEDVDDARLRAGLDRLFPDPEDYEQKRAAAMAVLRRLCVISGGPGTGKTYTVVKILALLAEQAQGRKLAVALAAPTGKAAARVQDAVRRALERFPADDAVHACIPAAAYTLHRLLGARPRSVYYRHDALNPLALDVLVVDEASMADLALMAKLVAALAPRTRLILLGDKDQLASVEAGAVLGDLCAENGLSAGFAARLASILGGAPSEEHTTARSSFGDSIALLHRSYRFGGHSAIGRLAKHVNGGEARAALELIESERPAGIAWHDVAAGDLRSALELRALPHLAAYLERVQSGAPGELFERFNAFRILCAHRAGAMGTTAVNRVLEAALEARGLIDARHAWYAGRPVMVTRNDYSVHLYNGDVGIALPDPNADGQLRVCFPAETGRVRKIAPSRLPEHETVYAMTVHKAQGSEFGHVLMLLPQELSRVMSRELVYTGITRARESVEIWGNEDVLRASIERHLARASALRERLWTPPAAELCDNPRLNLPNSEDR